MSTQPVDTGDLWRWVDRLTQTTRRRLTRKPVGEKPTVEYFDLPSLVDQLVDAQASSNGGGGRGKASPGSRAPIDLTITALLAEMSSLTIDALVAHDTHPHWKPGAGRTAAYGVRVVDVPASIRALAVTVVAARDDDLIDWWADRFCSWVLRAEDALDLDADDTLDLRPVRGVTCPDCSVDYVHEDRDGEDYRIPALTIAFRDGQVLHVTCRHCTRGWWRGEGIDLLAAALTAALTVDVAEDAQQDDDVVPESVPA